MPLRLDSKAPAFASPCQKSTECPYTAANSAVETHSRTPKGDTVFFVALIRTSRPILVIGRFLHFWLLARGDGHQATGTCSPFRKARSLALTDKPYELCKFESIVDT